MNRRGFALGSFIFTLAVVALTGSHCTAQGSPETATRNLGADSRQHSIEQVSLFENIYGESCGCSSACDTSCNAVDCGNSSCEGFSGDDACNFCDDCGSSITARIGFLYMKRESPDNVPIVFHNGGQVALSGADFNFDYEIGIDTSVIFDNGRLPAPIEFRYFRISDWVSSQPSTALTNGSINTTPNFGGGYSTMNYAKYLSRLESFELQFRKEMSCRLTLMAGFRYVSFDEDLDTLFDSGAQFWWGIENDLYGFQLGAEYVLYDNCCGFRIEAFGKAGIYGNDAKVATQVEAIEQLAVSQRSGMDHVSFLGELSLMGTYDLSCCWTVRAGYQVMWLDGVLVASNQVPVTDNNAVTLGYDYTDVVFHGAKIELERRW